MNSSNPCNQATLPQKWPPPPQNMADACELTKTTSLLLGSGRLILVLLSSYTQEFSVICDAGSVPRRAIFSPRGTSPRASLLLGSGRLILGLLPPVVSPDRIPARDTRCYYRGTSLMRNSPPRYDFHRALGILLLKAPRRPLFRMSVVPLYPCKDNHRPAAL